MQDLFDQSVQRRAQTGFHSDNDTEICEGLSEGGLVVANAGGSLRDDDRVKPVLPEITGLGQP
jgi:hypothetical protein